MTCKFRLQKTYRNYQNWILLTKKTTISSTFLIRSRFQGYRCEWWIAILARRFKWNYAYSPFNWQVFKKMYKTSSPLKVDLPLSTWFEDECLRGLSLVPIDWLIDTERLRSGTSGRHLYIFTSFWKGIKLNNVFVKLVLHQNIIIITTKRQQTF